jgi:phosphatidylserine/phosphatidylglycerophosphate/cardiolipin synthase-like enzyme
MKSILCMLSLSLFLGPRLLQAAPSGDIESAKIAFSRSNDCQAVILQEIEAVTQSTQPGRSIDLLMYSFTDRDIASAVIAAAKAGVSVSVIMDASEAGERGSVYPILSSALGNAVILTHGLPYREGSGFGIMHEKMAILNGTTVIIGSYNWTVAAHRENWENLMVITSPGLAAVCQAEFAKVLAYAQANPTGPIHGYSSY